MVHRTLDFEKELRKLEFAQKQAKMEEVALKQKMKAAKYRSRHNNMHASINATFVNNQAD